MFVIRGGKFTPELKEANDGKNLPLSLISRLVPQSGGVRVIGEGGSVHLLSPGELQTVCMHNIANKGKPVGKGNEKKMARAMKNVRRRKIERSNLLARRSIQSAHNDSIFLT